MSEQEGISVSRLNLIIAEAIRREPRIRSVTVRGEVSGFRNHIASGHWYFTLKDEESAVSCVMFRQNIRYAALRPTDGQSLIISGYVDVYPKNGSYQLYAQSLREAGTGDMHARFEALKRKLYAEGLFDASRKKRLPMLPRKVAVVTSESGAAIRDIWNVSARRNPAIPILLVPVAVQGDKAADEIARGIRTAAAQPGVDVIIVARGGGSAEDLWCFNEESVARAAAESPVPVVSGVGHEIDTTICDLASDIRAATPSNAAEIVFPDRKELYERIKGMETILLHVAEGALLKAEKQCREISMRMKALSPEKRIAALASRSSLNRAALTHAIMMRIEDKSGKLNLIRQKMNHTAANRVENASAIVLRIRERLTAINPMSVLNRGYAMVYAADGTLLTRREEALQRERMSIRFADGYVEVIQNGRQK